MISTDPDGVAAAKRALRPRLLAARANRPPDDLAAAADRFVVAAQPLVAEARRVAAYVAVAGEPPTILLLEAMRRAGVEVLLPAIAGPELRWAAYAGQDRLTTGRFGLREPAGPQRPRRALDGCDVVLVPALAVDRQGRRLGRGGGYYDRALAGVARRRGIALPAYAVVFADELLDRVPAAAHDVPVAGALTPNGVVRFALPLGR